MMWPRLSKEFSEVACGPSSTSTERTVSSACHAKGVDSWLFGGMQRLLQMSRYLLHDLLDDPGARPVCPCPSGAFRCPRLGNGCVQSHHPRRNLHPLCRKRADGLRASSPQPWRFANCRSKLRSRRQSQELGQRPSVHPRFVSTAC